jgi:Spy/CpxP family protein refolding chaperone
MRATKSFMMAVMALGLAASLGMFYAADEVKPKYDIEEIMAKAHKGKPSLLQQVVKGKASEEQKKQLLEYYQELAKNKPPKGDAKDWKRRTNALIVAAQDALAGKPNAARALQSAAKCGDCHKAHKED